MNNKTKFLKFTIAAILGSGLTGILYAQLSIESQIDNSVITMKQVNVVDSENNTIITLSGGSVTPVQIQGSTSIGDTTTNILRGKRSSILGGQLNKVKGDDNIVGGNANDISGSNSVIPGGKNNKITTDYGFVAGGESNEVRAKYGFAGGQNAISNAQGTFVWSDAYGITQFIGSVPNSFVIRANGGVGINTASPRAGYGLTLAGSGYVAGNLKIGDGGVSQPAAKLHVIGNVVSDAYYYKAITADDDLYSIKASQRNDSTSPVGAIYYNSGNVGVGVSSPTAKLHVNGTVRLQGITVGSQNTVLTTDTNGNISKRPLNAVAFNGYTAPVTSVAGKVGDVILTKGDVGLTNVDNTTDLQKPISTATQTALNAKANLASPALTGIPTATTAAATTNNTQIATTAFVKAQGYITSAPVTSVAGRAGVVTLTKGDVGLTNVDNTTDLQKPISTATQTALNAKANLASPALTGIPTATTAAATTNNTQIATTAFVKAQGYITSAPVTSVAGRAGVVTLNYKDIGFNTTANIPGNSNDPSLFDNGIHVSLVDANNTTYPTPWGTLATFKLSDHRSFQLYSNHLGENKLFLRNLYVGQNTKRDELYHTSNKPTKGDVGLTNVDNTTDLQKPISTATQTALNGKVPTARTITAGDGLSGGGTLAGDRALAVDSTVVRTSGVQTIGGTKTFSNNIILPREGAVGVYNAAQVQGIWSLGNNYKIDIDNNDFGSQYGIVYAHTNAGTDSNKKPISGRGHQILFTNNGVRNAAISLSEGNGYFGGNVGIGTITPLQKLHIEHSHPGDGGWNKGLLIKSNSSSIGEAAISFNNIGTASNNWIVGLNQGNNLDFAYGDAFTNANTKLSLNANGNVGIGTIAPSEKLEVNGNIKATAFYYSSDITLKKDLKQINNSLDKILALNGYYFTWKSDDTKDIGLIAQEVEKVFPDAVKADDKGLKSVKYGNLVAPIIESIKELYNKYLDQQEEINELEIRIQSLEKLLK